MVRLSVLFALPLILSACQTTVDLEALQPAQTTADTSLNTNNDQYSAFRCRNDNIAVDTAFSGGALASCTIDAEGNIDILIAPEDEPPINCSPWYSFRITPLTASAQRHKTRIKLRYTACGHRYWPKTSTDLVAWDYLPQDQVDISEFSGLDQARLAVDLAAGPIFVSAQEILTQATYDAWMGSQAEKDFAQQFVLGASAEGREIGGLTIGNADAREVVMLVGRQHPPEVTGALAMFPFMETILADTPLARAYRARFLTIAVPILNPDGVEHGYWRHNSGGVDLNRDWGPFTQPETLLMQSVLSEIEENLDKDLQLMLDFHSTGRDVFYTIPDELPTQPELFINRWLQRYQALMPNYNVNRDAKHTIGRPISKAHIYDTYGAPAVTFEIGDETDRLFIQQIGRQAAIAMMETLLARPASD